MHHDMSLLLRKTWEKISFQLQVHNEFLRSIQMNLAQKLARQEGHIHSKIHWHRLHTQWTTGKKKLGEEKDI